MFISYNTYLRKKLDEFQNSGTRLLYVQANGEFSALAYRYFYC